MYMQCKPLSMCGIIHLRQLDLQFRSIAVPSHDWATPRTLHYYIRSTLYLCVSGHSTAKFSSRTLGSPASSTSTSMLAVGLQSRKICNYCQQANSPTYNLTICAAGANMQHIHMRQAPSFKMLTLHTSFRLAGQFFTHRIHRSQ